MNLYNQCAHQGALKDQILSLTVSYCILSSQSGLSDTVCLNFILYLNW